MTALICGFSASMRSMAVSTSSRAETSPRLTRSASPRPSYWSYSANVLEEVGAGMAKVGGLGLENLVSVDDPRYARVWGLGTGDSAGRLFLKRKSPWH